MSIQIPFKTPEPFEFTEPGSGEIYEADICGKADVIEYDTSLYASEEDLKEAIRSNVTAIAIDSFAYWPSDKIIGTKVTSLLNSYYVAAFSKMGITADVNIASFKLTEESQKKYNSSEDNDPLAQFKKNQPTLDDLTPETHGPVVSIVTDFSSFGMAMNSGSSGRESVTWQDDGTVLIENKNSSYEKETIEKYVAGSEAAARLREYIAESRIAEMAQIKPIPFPYQITDYSSSSHMTFTFDDSAVSGNPKVTRTIDRSSFWEVQTDVVRKIDKLIKECETTGSLTEKTENEKKNTDSGLAAGMGYMGMGMMGFAGMTDIPKPAGNWKCPSCGSENSGRFCTDCGTRAPS